MKKNYFTLMAAVAVMGFTACQDDIEDITLQLGEEGTKEVNINRIGGIIEVPITTNGEWKASLPGDCDWLGLGDSIGSGNHMLEVFVDYNDPRFAEERRADLTVTAGDQTRTIRVRQYVGITDGENAAYINDSIGFNDLYLTRGLGFGVNIAPESEIDLLKYPLFSKCTLDELAKKDAKYKNVITETSDPQLIGNVGVKDTLEKRPQKLNIEATINVAYGLFKLDIYGKYKMGKFTDANNYKFDVAYDVPRVMATADGPTLEVLADDKDYSNYAFTPGFVTARKNVITSLDKAKLSDDELDKLASGDKSAWNASKLRSVRNALTKLNDNYGAFYVSRTKLGGSCTMHIECDTTALMDTTIVNGQITASFKNGMLDVSADVKAEYSNIASVVLRKGAYAFSIRGGSAQSNQNLTLALNVDKSQINVGGINKELANWIGTVPTELTSNEALQNMAVIDMGYMPIWSLFPIEYFDIVRAWFIMKYEGKNTIIDLNDFKDF